MFALLSLVLCFAAQIIATPQRVIVDDQYGDPITGAVPIYTAPQTGEWNQGATCVVCSAGSKIDRDNGLIVNKTWHDGTSGLDGAFSIDFNFTGYTVDVYFILAGNNLDPVVVVDTTLTILIDGKVVGNFQHDASQYTDYLYNQSIYSNQSMTNAKHSISIQTVGTQRSLLLFDYLAYTKDDDTLASSTDAVPTTTGASSSTPTSDQQQSNTNVAAIAGGVAGGVSVLVLLALFLCCVRRNSRERGNGNAVGDDETSLLSCFRRRHPRAADRVDLSHQWIGERPGSTTVVSSAYDHRAQRTPDPRYPQGAVFPYASPTSDYDSYKDYGDQTASTTLREQVQYLVDEVNRLRHREHDASEGSTYLANSEPPDYMSEVVQREPLSKEEMRLAATYERQLAALADSAAGDSRVSPLALAHHTDRFDRIVEEQQPVVPPPPQPTQQLSKWQRQ